MKSTAAAARKPAQKEGEWGGRVGCVQPTYYLLFFPWCLVLGLPLNLSRDKAAQGIIHLPDPFSFSGPLAGTFCPPPPTTTPNTPTLKHKTAPVRNSRTHSPFHAPPHPRLRLRRRPKEKQTWAVLQNNGRKTQTQRHFGSNKRAGGRR